MLQCLDVCLGKAEPFDRIKHPIGSGNNTEPTTLRETAGKDLERRPAVCDAATQGGLDHGEFVTVGCKPGRFHGTEFDSY